MQDSIPASHTKHSETPVFTQDTIPDGLLRDHRTKPGVWGRIVVSDGELIYLPQDRPAQSVAAGDTAVIRPAELHSVAPKGTVTFKVEFYRDSAKDGRS